MPDLQNDYRETTINVVHRPDRIAYIWTENRRWITRLKRLGFEPTKEEGAGMWFAIPERAIWLKNPHKKRLSDARRAVLVASTFGRQRAPKP